MDDGNGCEQEADTADAFSLLGNDVRLGILRALAGAEREHGDASGSYDVGFSTLYDRVDVESSSAFAYHLDELDGVFVERTDDGYRLTDRGQRVVRAVLAGTYTERADFGPVSLDGYCPICGATTLEAAHESDRLVISCPDCSTGLVSEELTASQVAGRTDDEVLSSIGVRVRTDLEQAVDGVCGACGGPIESTIDSVQVEHGERWVFRGDCQACQRRVNAPIEWCLFAHPAVVAFYWEHGIVLRDEPIWEAFQRLEGEEWTVHRSEDGFDCVVTLEDDELRLDVSMGLSVRDATLTQRALSNQSNNTST